MEEECLLRSSVIRDIAIASLRVIRIARVVLVDGCPRSAALLIVVLWCLYPALRHVVVAQLCKDRIVAYTRISIKYEYYIKTKNIIITLDAI